MTGGRAVIIGAGIGGLAAAAALRRAGWSARVFERAQHARDLGFGLLLAPNALTALRELGISGELPGAVGEGFEVRRANGTCVRRFSAPPAGRVVVALRRDLYTKLLGAAGDALTLSSDAIAFVDDTSSATVRFANGSSETGDVIVGADGIASATRRWLHPEAPPLRPSGYCALRGVAYGVRKLLGGLSGIGYFDSGMEAAMIAAGADAVYWYFSLLTRDLTLAERTPNTLRGRLLDRVERPFQEVLAATCDGDQRFDELLTQAPLGSWGRGRVTLLGDAAHPLLPHTGQGAAQALEDAVALGLVLSGSSDVSHALRTYERVRSARTRRFVRLGPRIARVTTTRRPLVAVLRNVAVRHVPESLVAALARRDGDPHRALRRS